MPVIRSVTVMFGLADGVAGGWVVCARQYKMTQK